MVTLSANNFTVLLVTTEDMSFTVDISSVGISSVSSFKYPLEKCYRCNPQKLNSLHHHSPSAIHLASEFPPNETTPYLEILRCTCISNYSCEFMYILATDQVCTSSSFLVKCCEVLKEDVKSSQLRLVAIITFIQCGTAYLLYIKVIFSERA